MPKYTLSDLGYNLTLTKSSFQEIDQTTPESSSVIMGGTSAKNITSGELSAQLTYVKGAMQSSNFVTGSTGWEINSDGDVEFNNGTFRGHLLAGYVDIPDTTTANSFHVDNQGNTWWGATTLAAAPAKVTKAGVATFTGLVISGYIPTGGAAADVNAGAVTINASKVNISGLTTFAAGYDPTGKTTPGEVTTIIGNTVTTGFVNALSVTAGSVAAENISGTFITGKTIRTAASGARVQLDGSNYLQAYDANYLRVKLDTSALYFYDENGTLRGKLQSLSSAGAGINITEGDLLIANEMSLAATKWIKWGGNNVLSVSGDTSKVQFAIDVCPNSDTLYDLGQSSARWVQSHVKSMYVYGAQATGAIISYDGSSVTLDKGLVVTGTLLPDGDETRNIGSTSYGWNVGYINKIEAANGNVIDLDTEAANILTNKNFVPSSDNAVTCGSSGSRWSDTRTVKLNGADIGFANGWKFREFPCKKKDISKPEAWMKKHANQGIQLLDEKEKVMAIFHKDGNIYIKGNIKSLKELCLKK